MPRLQYTVIYSIQLRAKATRPRGHRRTKRGWQLSFWHVPVLRRRHSPRAVRWLQPRNDACVHENVAVSKHFDMENVSWKRGNVESENMRKRNMEMWKDMERYGKSIQLAFFLLQSWTFPKRTVRLKLSFQRHLKTNSLWTRWSSKNHSECNETCQ